MIYSIWYDYGFDDHEVWLEGPDDIDDWEGFCNGFIEAAANELLAESPEETRYSPISMADIIYRVIEILQRRGFKLMEVTEKRKASYRFEGEISNQPHFGYEKLITDELRQHIIARNERVAKLQQENFSINDVYIDGASHDRPN